MKLHSISFIASLSALGFLTLVAPSEHITAAPSAVSHTPEHSAVTGHEFSPVYSPRVPEKVHFAGKTISLDHSDMWERLDRELTAMTYTHGNTLLTLKRANRFFPVMAPIIKAQGLPSDIIYLAAIESSLNPRAVSAAKAGGMWQFMPSTAKEYGLEVNNEVDERFDVEKSTLAACKYLKNAYSRYGNWESVAASYNGGMARITNELDAQQASSAYDLWLADETMRYIYRLLAMKMIMGNPSDYGFHLTKDQLYQPLEYKSIQVSGPVDSWADWAVANGTDYKTLREHNPWIRAKSLTNKSGRTYTVRIPTKDSLSRHSQKKTVYTPAWVKD